MLRAMPDPGVPVRETFWNIPFAAEVFVYAGGLLSLALCAWGVWQRVRLWRGGAAEARLDHWPRRCVRPSARRGCWRSPTPV